MMPVLRSPCILFHSQLALCSATEANKYSQEQLQLMKGQDIKYVALKSQAEAKVSLPPTLTTWLQSMTSSQVFLFAAAAVGTPRYLLKPVPGLAEGGEAAEIIALHRSPSAKQAHGVP